MKSFSITILVLAVLMVACTPGKAPEANPPLADSAATEPEMPAVEAEETTGEREPTDNEIREVGILDSIDDAGYPMFIVSVEFPKREHRVDFMLNMEEIPPAQRNIHERLGSYVSFYYELYDDVNIYDIEVEGESILEYTPEDHDGLTVFTGILQGADEPTPGDLPSEIRVTNAQGEELVAEYYVAEAEVAANGKEVTVYYLMRGTQKITYFEPASEE